MLLFSWMFQYDIRCDQRKSEVFFFKLAFFVVVSLGIIMTVFTLKLLVILYKIKLSTLRRQVYLNTNDQYNLDSKTQCNVLAYEIETQKM